MAVLAWKPILTTLALGLGLFGSTHAQSSAFTDPQTGITYQQITRGDYTFGIALPENITTDFIGRISARGSQGWAGVSLGGRMVNSLMVVAWPHETKIKASLRYSSGYASPGPNSNASISLKIIPAGTSFDGTTYIYTFLCKGCIHTDRSTFQADANLPYLGYAHAADAVSSPVNTLSTLSYHASGSGLFQANLAAARSQRFTTWAAMARDTPSPPDNSISGVTPPPNNDTVLVSNSTYDYIVVGGGPSGLITSQRLTETGRSVLLIERGLASTASTGGKRFVPWNESLTYYDVPGVFDSLASATSGEGYCRDTAAVAGCILGGGGSVNGMAFIHPPSWDFDDSWPSGWKWSDVAPSAARLYARNPGTTLPSSDGKYYDNAVYTVLEGWFKDNGWDFADSIKQSDNKTRSYGPPSINVANGLRSGPIHTYLPLAQAKSTFKLQLNTKVIRVIRNGSSITGVETETAQGREIINLQPGGGILLAAGAMSTPRILFNSGIGPSKQINIVKSGTTKVKLPDERDWISLPVGMEMKDHSRYMLYFNVTDGMATKSKQELMKPSEAEKDLFRAGSGVLTQSFQRLDTFRRIKTSDGHSIMLQSHCSSPQNDTVQLMLLMTHGLTSRGVLSINSAGNTLFSKEPWTNTDTDREAWTMALDELLNMARKPGSRLVYSGGRNATAASILSTPVQQGIHVAGGAKMGADDGRQGGSAVVDLNNKVYGTNNLFVVDASFHPDLSTGNNQAFVMVAAEHAIQKIMQREVRRM